MFILLQHNTHHAVPNLVESSPDAHDGDPDIDTMPILAWSLTMATKAQNSKWGRFFIRSVLPLVFELRDLLSFYLTCLWSCGSTGIRR